MIKIPKLGWVKYRHSRVVEGRIKNVTISRKSGQYRLSIQTEREVEEVIHESKTAVGIDLGVVNFATLSDGVVIAAKNSFKSLSGKLAKAQRKLKAKASDSKSSYEDCACEEGFFTSNIKYNQQKPRHDCDGGFKNLQHE